ncbi:MAG: FtsX-like permease family protein, partial [Thermoguttaceae bacterium]|nr:FtsX-like permease family protein [Thermoguttaceae bacterium]
MNRLRLILASLAYYRRIHTALALGAAVATAVMVGALAVGDSMRASLRRLTLDRLGRIDEALVAEHFFREELAGELAAAAPGHVSAAVPAVLLRVSIETAEGSKPARVNQVQLVGCDERFWALGQRAPDLLPEDRQIVLNRPLAEQLGVSERDEVVLRLPRVGGIPGDSPLGRKTGTVRGHRAVVRRIIPAEGLGRFSLSASQREPRNAYVAIDWLQERLEQPGRANAILVAGEVSPSPGAENAARVPRAWRPLPEDYGLRIETTRLGYVNITSERMMLDPAAEQEILRGLGALGVERVQPALVYLANTMVRATGSERAAPPGREIPYSTVAALDFDDRPPLGPMRSRDGKPVAPLGHGEIALNAWAADELGAKPGDTIRLAYFEPKSAHGEVRQQWAEFRLAAVVALEGAAADRAFTPEVPGLTDRRSIASWDPPFPFDAGRVRPKDEAYWNQHRGTPKAFVSLADGQRLWGSRFGRLTSIRVALPETLGIQALRQKLSLDPAAMGFVFQPVKRQGLEASAGTTDFEFLFLGFSFFLIGSAAMLVALLFRLAIVQRAPQIGALLALGFTRRRIHRLLLAEGSAVAGIGGLVGVGLGIGYAALMLAGLETLWIEAVATRFLYLDVTGRSLGLGYLFGVLVSVAAIALATREVSRASPRRLLAGETSSESRWLGTRPRRAALAGWALLAGAGALAATAAGLDEHAQAGAFFGAAALVLVAVMLILWTRLAAGATGAAVAPGRGNLFRLAARNAARHPGRSTLAIGLVAAASFLIVAASAFRADVSRRAPDRSRGDGGFSLVAESDQPVHADLNTEAGRAALGLSTEDSRLLAGATVYALRLHPGDDASCLNLYRPRRPRVLGVPPALVERGGFAWSATAAADAAERDNPWRMLDRPLDRDPDGTPRVPVVLDAATATYSLHLGRAVGATFDITDGRGRPLRLEVVGLLRDSIFQGDVLLGERAFREHFPQHSGYRMFLVESPDADTPAVRQVLERDLGDYGLAVETTGQRLARFLAVQNTYLMTFQSLGGLGLLLGTLGLAAVQLRSVFERRGELALLRATGFRRATLAWLVTLENALLLATGLAAGVLAAAVAVLPHWLAGQAVLPVPWLAGTLGLVFATGLLAGVVAVRAAVAVPLLAALR